jgi:nucleotide-binding universal stress UspA family protein
MWHETMDVRRPDPDRLLSGVASEEAGAHHGKLKVFLGAALESERRSPCSARPASCASRASSSSWTWLRLMEYLVRVTRRFAARQQAPWTVAYVETGDRSRTDRDRLQAVFALTERLRGETVVLRGEDIAEELLSYASRHGVSSILVGRTRERPLARMFGRTVTLRLLTSATSAPRSAPHRRPRAVIERSIACRSPLQFTGDLLLPGTADDPACEVADP